MNSNSGHIVHTSGWFWRRERLILIEGVDLFWRQQPRNEYHSEKIDIFIDGKMTVHPGYMWDGATGVPTGKFLDPCEDVPVKSLTSSHVPSEWNSTLRHDVSYDHIGVRDKFGNEYPFSRTEADAELYYDLQASNFPFARLYYVGVSIFGGLVLIGKKLKRILYHN